MNFKSYETTKTELQGFLNEIRQGDRSKGQETVRQLYTLLETVSDLLPHGPMKNLLTQTMHALVAECLVKHN